MTKRTGYLWAVIQDWLDTQPFPPSQNKLAARLEVSASALGDYKYATHMPSPEFLERLAELMRVHYEVVLDATLKDHGYRRPDSEGGGERARSAPNTRAGDAGAADELSTRRGRVAAPVKKAARKSTGSKPPKD